MIILESFRRFALETLHLPSPPNEASARSVGRSSQWSPRLKTALQNPSLLDLRGRPHGPGFILSGPIQREASSFTRSHPSSGTTQGGAAYTEPMYGTYGRNSNAVTTR